MGRVKGEELRHAAPAEGAISAGERRAVMRARELGMDLGEAVEAFSVSAERRARSCSVAELVGKRAEWLERGGFSREYIYGVRALHRRAVEMWGRLAVCDITPEMAAEFIFSPGGSALTIRNRKIMLGGLFGYGESLGLATGNPAAKVRTPTKGGGRVALLSPEEARRYLAAVAEAAPGFLGAEAIRLFAGLRRAEVARLQWSQVWLERGLIEVGAHQAKTKARRLIDIEPALSVIIQQVERVGKVVPPNRQKLLEDAQRLGGWRTDAGSSWPENCLRHSFVSYHLALYGDPGRTELQAGHDRAIMYRHYRELVTAEAAEEFWGLRMEI